MAARPRLLDLFCGAGGAAVGYHRAGFDVVGVDIKHQKNYPFAFVQADALEYCREHGHEFDAIHASPPCQAFSPLRARWPRGEYVDLVAETRDELKAIGRPYVIENVVQAPLDSGIVLCGTMFPPLRVYRHRRFESSVLMMQPEHPKHVKGTGSGKGQRQRKAHFLAGNFITVTGNVGTYCGPEGMGIDWMTGDELSQAIPPAYTEHVGQQLMGALQ